MFLTKNEILEELERGRLKIEPFFKSSLGELTYDIALGNEFVFVKTEEVPFIDVEDLQNLKLERVFEDQIILHPKQFVLARSLEWIELPSDILGLISGKSSLARLGIQVESAYLLKPGHTGYVVLEISNRNDVPVKLKAGMLIAQVLFAKVKEVESYLKVGTFKKQERIELPKELKFIKEGT